MLIKYSDLPQEQEEIVSATIGCAIAVHRELGPGFKESIYHQAFRLELNSRSITFESEKPILVKYREWVIPGQKIDLIVCGNSDRRVEGCATLAADAPISGAVVPPNNLFTDWSASELQCSVDEIRDSSRTSAADVAGRAARSAAEVTSELQIQAAPTTRAVCICSSHVTSVAGLRPAPDRLACVPNDFVRSSSILRFFDSST